MKKTILSILLTLALAVSLLSGCAGGQTGAPSDASADASAPASSAAAERTAHTGEDAAVASGSELAPAAELDLEGLEPVAAAALNPGSYPVRVDSSSTMFRITDCTLTVTEEGMRADMTMGGTGYLWLYPGTGAEAAASEEAQRIPFAEDEAGAHHFTLPVEALNQPLPCAAFSKRREKWYERTLVFRADSLPREAWKDAPGTAPELADGSYQVEVTLSGGSGRASVESPTELTVQDGVCTARIVWSSPNYDFMLTADGTRLEPVNTEGNSAFDVPVSVLDAPVQVQADTTAMSAPHLIDYTLVFHLVQ